VNSATLDLLLDQYNGGTYSVALRFRAPNSAAETRLVSNAAVQIDQQRLHELALDADAYGRALTKQLFADPQLRVAWLKTFAEARHVAAPLRVRLLLDAGDAALNAIRWETLRDPERPDGLPLVADEQVTLLRVPTSNDLAPVTLHERDQLRIAIAVAGPRDLADFGLAPVDITAEAGRVQSQLTAFSPTLLARGVSEHGATLDALLAALRDGADILYLVAHGTRVDGEAYLWLEQNDGSAAWVDSSDLAARINGLSRRPVLVFLASCGSGAGLSAIGSRLAAAGVAAVVAMQGDIAIGTVAQLAPAFFRELQRDGDVERALAVARGSVLDRSDWWLPVLSSRLVDGRIWLTSGPYTVTRDLRAHSPFRALDAFRVEDAHLFFGRDALIEEGYGPWVASDRRFLAVVGASGSGKSSLAMAGLIPRFCADLCELGYATTTIILRPGQRPLHALRDALRRQGLRLPPDFVERLAAEPGMLLEVLTPQPPLRRAEEGEPRRGGGEGHTLLLIDQFEELFTLCQDAAQRAAFDAALCHVIEHGGEAASVLLTLRSDFYRPTADLGLRWHIATYQVHVRNLNAEEMAAAIEEPVRRSPAPGRRSSHLAWSSRWLPIPAPARARCRSWNSLCTNSGRTVHSTWQPTSSVAV
jgi:hypothetical protein